MSTAETIVSWVKFGFYYGDSSFEAGSSYEFVSESMSSRSIYDLDMGSKWLADLGSESTILLSDMGSGSLDLVLERSLAIRQVTNILGWLRFLGV